MEATLPTQTATWSLLSLAYRRACSVIRSSSQATTAAPQLITKAHQAVKRFGTFQLLTHGSEQGEMVASSFSAGEWHRFRVGALLDEVKSAFARGRIKDGIVLWRRHYMGRMMLSFSSSSLFFYV